MTNSVHGDPSISPSLLPANFVGIPVGRSKLPYVSTLRIYVKKNNEIIVLMIFGFKYFLLVDNVKQIKSIKQRNQRHTKIIYSAEKFDNGEIPMG
jgi:hypothetical protein